MITIRLNDGEKEHFRKAVPSTVPHVINSDTLSFKKEHYHDIVNALKGYNLKKSQVKHKNLDHMDAIYNTQTALGKMTAILRMMEIPETTAEFDNLLEQVDAADAANKEVIQGEVGLEVVDYDEEEEQEDEETQEPDVTAKGRK